VPAELDEDDEEMLDRKFGMYGLTRPPEIRKFVCGKRLWNYDTLEPSERKLIL
jgi:methylamine---glutamate N-methyltransferase subunit B